MNSPSTTTAPAFTTARRINQSLTASLEKRSLEWLAEHAPRWLTSDQLTLLGLLSQIAAGLCYAFARHHRDILPLAILCIALNWLGDSLDGTLARVRHQQRPRYGFYVDHMVDLFGALALMGGLACSGLLHPQTAIAMLVAFLLLSSESYLATYTLSYFQLSQGLFGPTEIRILFILGNLALLRSPFRMLFGHRLLLFDMGGAIAAAVMFAMAIVTTLRHTAELYRQEPIVRQEPLESQYPIKSQQPVDSHQSINNQAGNANPGTPAMNPLIRWGKFNLVGVMGMAVQLTALALFTRLAPGYYLYASAAAVELTLFHNFLWHIHYTWRDRRAASQPLRQLLRFHLSNGLVSLLGNLVLMRFLVHNPHIPILASNCVAILCCSVVNFLLGTKWAFAIKPSNSNPGIYIPDKQRNCP